MTRLDRIISENINRVKRLWESQGVVENGMVEFAEYLWKRCINNKIKPDRYGEIHFAIPAKQWSKFNKYGMTNDKINICISDRDTSADASFSTLFGQPEITISQDLIRQGHGHFIAVLMHEITHAVNAFANLKDGESPHDRGNFTGKLHRIGTNSQSKEGLIEYLFNPTEMNARLTDAYYHLSHYYHNQNNWSRLQEYANYSTNYNEIATYLFGKIQLYTRYSEMEELIKNVFLDMKTWVAPTDRYSAYKGDINGGDMIVTNKLRLGNNKPNQDHTFNQYFKRRMDMAFYMQKNLENFQKRIYKMISKFMHEIGIY